MLRVTGAEEHGLDVLSWTQPLALDRSQPSLRPPSRSHAVYSLSRRFEQPLQPKHWRPLTAAAAGARRMTPRAASKNEAQTSAAIRMTAAAAGARPTTP